MEKNKKTFLLMGIFIISVILHITGILVKNVNLINSATILTFSSLCLIYVVLAKRINLWVLAHLLLILIAELLLLFERNLSYAMALSIIAQIILVKLIIGLKYIRFSSSAIYFLVTILGYSVIYLYVINIEVGWVILIYGLVNSLVVSLGMANYLKKMYWANYLLFLGVAFWVLSNAFLSLNLFSFKVNIFVSVTNALTHFFICISFVIRTDKLSPKKGVLKYKSKL